KIQACSGKAETKRVAVNERVEQHFTQVCAFSSLVGEQKAHAYDKWISHSFARSYVITECSIHDSR
ncbi:MAG TPA: hypothetical protein VF311_06435, partial [Terriglobales bacterium]